MTTRSLERRGAFTLACMALLIVIVVVMWLASALAEPLPQPKLSGPGGSFAAPQLPNAMFGPVWCFHKPYENDPDPHIIFAEDNFDACANRGGVRFWRRSGKSGYQLGRFDWRVDCEISKIDLVGRRRKVYRVQSACKYNDDEPQKYNFKLWRSKTGMHWQDLE
jgi:hypothetical protein